MIELYDHKSSYETHLQNLISVQGEMILTTLAVLILSFVVSRALFHVFGSLTFFHYSALLILITGLLLLGYQLKKARKLEQETVNALVQGMKLEKESEQKKYFRDATKSYRKERKFIVRIACFLGLSWLILSWVKTILAASGASEEQCFLYVVVSSALLGFFASLLISYVTTPFRTLTRELKNMPSL